MDEKFDDLKEDIKNAKAIMDEHLEQNRQDHKDFYLRIERADKELSNIQNTLKIVWGGISTLGVGIATLFLKAFGKN